MVGVTLPQLGLPLQGSRIRIEKTNRTCASVVRLADELIVGSFELEVEGSTLTIRSLCIEPPYRSYGAGSEAAQLLIAAAETAGFTHARAWAHPKLGLSAYFWGRMGLRPLHGEGPEGGIWYERLVAGRVG